MYSNFKVLLLRPLDPKNCPLSWPHDPKTGPLLRPLDPNTGPLLKSLDPKTGPPLKSLDPKTGPLLKPHYPRTSGPYEDHLFWSQTYIFSVLGFKVPFCLFQGWSFQRSFTLNSATRKIIIYCTCKTYMSYKHLIHGPLQRGGWGVRPPLEWLRLPWKK